MKSDIIHDFLYDLEDVQQDVKGLLYIKLKDAETLINAIKDLNIKIEHIKRVYQATIDDLEDEDEY